MSTIFDRSAIDFLLFEVLRVDRFCGRGRYLDHDRESLTAVLDLAQRISEEHLWPHAAKSDREEPYLKDGRVRILPEVIESLSVLKNAGFFSAHADYDLGGMQLPVSVNNACNGMLKGSNAGTHAFMSLTRAAANLINAYGNPEQKEQLMKPMLEGRFFGTMCLSEPDVGSSLGDLTTRAIPDGQGDYSIKGNKMWISAGDHDAAENIIHLVLARLPDAPEGIKGISLFAVPKYRLNEDASIGDWNGVTVAGLNHKMGYRGTSNCLLNFGESGRSIGSLVGDRNRGLVAMFHMMNEARISVGIGAAMLGAVGYHLSLDYARQRTQGRRLADKDPESRPVAIIKHPDVRRMLLQQKSYVEGSVALCLYAGALVDECQVSENQADSQRQTDLLDVLTPIVKAWPSEFALEANKLAIQVLGGAGYTRDFPVERLYRDNRLNAIHEGTNGIQALDLLGRKALLNDSRAFFVLDETIRRIVAVAKRAGILVEQSEDLVKHLDKARRHVDCIRLKMAGGKVEESLALATSFLHAMGHIVVGWLLIRQGIVARTLISNNSRQYDEAFLQGKIRVCKYFIEYELPMADTWLDNAGRSPDTLLDIDEGEF